ncbi:MAG TPA: glycosyltransferase family 2 protein [Candidatus Dojkabacteria bacterium]|jgi:glycosyltransferase involved in cell wall biosynthesis
MRSRFRKISVVIPAYNEESVVAEIINKVKAADVFGLEKEIIVVDNDSSDRTMQVVSSIPGIRVFTEKNRGKGAAVKKGFKEATGDILLIQDADLEYDPNDYQAVIKPILDDITEITNGVRIKRRHKNQPRFLYFFAWLGNHVITLTTNTLYLNNAKEYEGCYKALTKKLYDSVKVSADDFDFENELICKILKRGIKPMDVPIHYYPRTYAEGKKINWRHGFKILRTVIKYRFVD